VVATSCPLILAAPAAIIAGVSRAARHGVIHRLTRLFGRLVGQLPPGGPRPDDLRDLRRVLYGLHAILTLHFAQEEELYTLFE
jgi:hypothetical protein